ncbi:MAG: riboflavin biosynthesis protein RibF, partial [Acidimicrobiia bacterium]|nr:riboflavin biosynthesis protein RibF [Acidimicrobiia bacterium]
FDGVHRGHQAVIGALQSQAGSNPVGVVTFRQHPLSELQPSMAPPMLTSLEQRLELLEALGVEAVAVLEFSEIRPLEPAEFVSTIVSGVMNAAHLAVGRGFRFGHQMAGDETTLRELGVQHGFDVTILDIVGGSVPVRSTAIREALGNGDVTAAAAMLGRPFQLRGAVIQGDQRGRQLGFPTANLEVETGRAMPGRGVYSAYTTSGDGTTHASVVNIGVRPTFGEFAEVAEVHLLDTRIDLYGQELSVDFVERIRSERRFSGIDELVEQIGRDIETARAQLDAYSR